MPSVFITGIARCGSTWSSRVIAAYSRARFLHEPLNPASRFGTPGYSYIHLPDGGVPAELAAHVRWHMHGGGRLKAWLHRRRRVVLKLIPGVLATRALAQLFGSTVIVQLRHPCAVAASWHRMGRGFDPEEIRSAILADRNMAGSGLEPFADRLRAAESFYEKVGAIWGTLYDWLQTQQDPSMPWLTVRYEQLAAEGHQAFEQVLRTMGWPIHDDGQRFLQAHNRPPTDYEFKRVDDTFRQSHQALNAWREKLTDQQQQEVISTASVSKAFAEHYLDDDPAADHEQGHMPNMNADGSSA